MLDAGRLQTRNESELGRTRESGERCPKRKDEGWRDDVPILKVTLALGSDLARDANGSTAVGDTGREAADVASLVATGEAEVVAEKESRGKRSFRRCSNEATYSSP